MNDVSVLIGGKAGDGVREAGLNLARLLGTRGYRVYHLYDYPSLIRGGHNFSLVRGARDKIGAHRDKVDFLLALDRETVSRHAGKLRENGVVIFDSDAAEAEGIGLPMSSIVKEEKALPVMRSSCLIGCFCRAAGIEWDVAERVLSRSFPRERELNLKLAERGYEGAREHSRLEPLDREALPLVTGNEAIALGLIAAGLDAYIAYPMTPASSVLHFLAGRAEEFGITVVHPENEIAVMLMALGFSYAGRRAAVGTSGGGFCLMTEGLSLAGMAELPVAIVLSQRPGPSTGVPTYTAQADLNFVLSAGQGEFPRLVVAPGDAEEAYRWSAVALRMAWKRQIPSLVLVDKALSEGGFSFDSRSVGEISGADAAEWSGKGAYGRYRITDSGVSPLAFPGAAGAVVKVNSYEHDELGITTEDAASIAAMQEKRLRKEEGIRRDCDGYGCVRVAGDPSAPVALVCWGSNKGVCEEAGRGRGLRVVRPVVMSPFPAAELRKALEGVKRVICAENNATGELAGLLKRHGLTVDERVSRYDGRSFSVEEMEREIGRALG